MMDEITKLYKNAEVNQICDTFVHWMQCEWETKQCKDCEHFVYPPFTAEKQIELIKYLSKLGMFEIIECDYYQISLDFDVIWTDRLYVGEATTFEEALAKLLITIWEDISENTQEEIRSILRA